MAKKSMNFAGYATPAARARRSKRANSPKNLLATMKFLGMSEKDQREFLEKAKAEQDASTQSASSLKEKP